MRWFREKKDNFIRSLSYLLKQVFLHTKGSWGPVIIDENGNIIDESYQEK